MKKKISLEDIFLTALGPNQRLKWFLQYNISIVNYLDARWHKYMALADITLAVIPKNKILEMIKNITKERILEVLEKERPDLFKTINNEKGLFWLERQIVFFRKRFL